MWRGGAARRPEIIERQRRLGHAASALRLADEMFSVDP
jgi:hypothetical protein